MPHETRKAETCPQDAILRSLILRDSGNEGCLADPATHLRSCLGCAERQRRLLEGAMARVCLDFQPQEWEIFYRHRVRRQGLRHIGLMLGVDWRRAGIISAAVLHALHQQLEED